MTIAVTPQRLGVLLRPHSVALVGAADKSGFSQMAYRNLVDFGLGEHTYLVNRRGVTAHGRPTVTSCTQISEPVDVAFMMVPQAATLAALSDAAAAGIRHALVLSSGYADAGPAARGSPGMAVTATWSTKLAKPRWFGPTRSIPSASAWATRSAWARCPAAPASA